VVLAGAQLQGAILTGVRSLTPDQLANAETDETTVRDDPLGDLDTEPNCPSKSATSRTACNREMATDLCGVSRVPTVVDRKERVTQTHYSV
jgi:hypothetical protein